MSITSALKVLNQQCLIFKDTIKKKIESLPDNPNIKRIGKNSFTMSMSDLGKDLNLSPEHYDFKHQYNVILNELQKSEPTVFYKKITSIIEDGKLPNNPLVFHSDVRKYLKEIL